MTIRRRVHNVLNGPKRKTDAHETVELARVPTLSGPVTVALLQQEGFNVTGYECADAACLRSEYRILIPRSEFERAATKLNSLL